MSARTLAVGGALLIALAAPASASAAVMEPLKPCYVTAETASGPQSEGVPISASGFTPNSTVDLTIDGAPIDGSTGLQTSPEGALILPPNSVPAPFIPKGSRDFTVTLTEVGNPANTVSATAKTTALGVSVKPKRTRPSNRVRFKGGGFTADKPVYAHYLHKGKVQRTVRMARDTGTCGTWRARKRQIPVDDPGRGLWTVQFDQSKKYVDPASGRLNSVFVRLAIRVTIERS